MSVKQRVYKIDRENKEMFDEAKSHPVLIELDGKAYVLSIREVNNSPFTVETARASLPSLEGRGYVSDGDLEDSIRQANEKHAREIRDQMASG